jgi:hypothetical protein
MAKAKKTAKPKTQAEQSERFLRAAEEAGADKSGKEFERALKKIIPKKTSQRRPRTHS